MNGVSFVIPQLTAPASAAICVLGMHRSGTSALTGLLHRLGMEVGADLMPVGPDNPKGFWEHGHIVSAHIGLLEVMGSYFADFCPLREGWERTEDARWYQDYIIQNIYQKEFVGKPLWGFKDPRACRLLPLWHAIFERIGVTPRFVLLTRHPVEVMASLMQRQAIKPNQCMLLWLAHTLEAEQQTRGRRRVILNFEQVMGDWRRQAIRIGVQLGIQWSSSPQTAGPNIESFLDPSLRHYRATAEAPTAGGADPRIMAWAYSVHHALVAMSEDRGTPVDVATIDRVRMEFNLSLPALMDLRPPRPKGQLLTTHYTNAEKMLTRAN